VTAARTFSLPVDSGLELRCFEDADAAPLFALVDANRAHLRRWLPWVDGIATAEDERAFIGRARTQFEGSDGPSFGIWEHGALVGAIGLLPIDHANRATEIGYWLAEVAQGRGIITRACRALLGHCFSELGLHRVAIQCATGNMRSAAIPRRLGFRLEGTLREAEWLYDRWVDHHVYATLEDEWRSAEARA
jgi:ribosomal-protein-serine acetyltransferase